MSPDSSLKTRIVTSCSDPTYNSRAQISERYKLIVSGGLRYLYDLSLDSKEANNLIEVAPIEAGYLNSLLRLELQYSSLYSPNATSLSEQELESLRDLGYLH